MKQSKTLQKELFSDPILRNDYNSVFKKLYYNLYTNSKSSRAETIIEDLSKILLIKLATKNLDLKNALELFMSSKLSANDLLIKEFYSYYPNLVNSLSEFSLDSNSIRLCFQELESLDINDSPSHIIGDAFQALIGPTLRGDKGQFFTPKSIVSAMVEIVKPDINSKIVDPACGTGGFLIESFSQIVSNYREFNGRLFGIDKDKFLSNTAKSICEIYSSGKYAIINQNSLDLNLLKKEHSELFDADIVLTNPPFGSKIGVNDRNLLKQFELGYNWIYNSSNEVWVKTNQILNEQDPQTLFIELCVNLLKEGGVLGIVLPEGLFGNKGDGYIWDFLRKNGEIIAMIDCPRTAFQPSTDVKTNILFYKKTQFTDSIKNKSFKIAVAINCGHDRRGRTRMESGDDYPDDFSIISKEFTLEKSTHWAEGNVKDPYYLVPRYCQVNNNQEIKLNGSINDFIGIFSFAELIAKKYIMVKKGNEVGSEAYGTGDIPFIRTSDIANLEITNDPTKSVSEDYYEKYRKIQGIKEFDILMVADGRYRIGKTAILIGDKRKCVVQSHVKIIRVLPAAPFTAFELLYILNQYYIVNQIRNLIFIQSTLGSLGNRINELLIPIPRKSDLWKEKIIAFEKVLRSRNDLLVKIKEFQVELTF